MNLYESVDKPLRRNRTPLRQPAAFAIYEDPMLTPFLLKRLTDVAIILAVSAAIAFVIIASGNSLVARGSLARSYTLWINFITRPDIIVTTVLAVIVTMGVINYNAAGRR